MEFGSRFIIYETYREALDVEIVDSGELQEIASLDFPRPADVHPAHATTKTMGTTNEDDIQCISTCTVHEYRWERAQGNQVRCIFERVTTRQSRAVVS